MFILFIMRHTKIKSLKSVSNARESLREKSLNRKVALLQKKICKSQGELIVVYTAYYERVKKTAHEYYDSFFSLERYIQTGIITPETIVSNSDEFLTGIKNSYYKEIGVAYDRDFQALDNDRFIRFPLRTPLSHLKGKQPDEEYFLYHQLAHFPEDPSLYLKIGNNEAIPLLQKTLESWRYIELSRLLGIELPLNDKILNGLKEDKLKIFHELISLETQIPKLEKARAALLESASDRDYLLSEPAIRVNYGDAIRNAKTRQEILLEKAIKRRYHDSEICGKVEIGDRITKTTINLLEYFSTRKAMLGV